MATKAKRTTVFYGDPGAEEAFKKIDKAAAEVLSSLTDPSSPLHKTLSKTDLPRVIERLLKHYEFRAQLDWSKEQYYEVGSGNPSPTMPTFMLGVHGGEVSTFE